MKLSLPLFITALLSLCWLPSLEAQWVRQYPLDKLEDVLDLDVSTDGYGFAAGNNDLLLRLNSETKEWDLLPGFGEGWRFESIDYMEGSGGHVAAAGGQGLIYTLDKGNNWNEVPGAPTGIHTIKLFSPSHIIAISDEGAFEWENDQWKNLNVPATVGIKGAFILDNQHIWVYTFATEPHIYYTSNGGYSWDDNTDIEDIDVVRFYDATNGIATDGRKIFNTINGGVNWTEVSNNAIHNTSNDITFGSSLNVLMAVTNNDPAISLNGGLTWTKLSLETVNQRSYSVVAISDVEFWIGSDLTGVAHSVDQGATWTETSGPDRNLIQDVYFISRGIGFALGQKGMVLRTTDGGDNWKDISFGTRSHLSIHGLDVDDLWLGANQRIFHSSDTGSTWTEAAVFLGGNIIDILALSTDRILAATTNGVILRSKNAGATWDTVYTITGQMRSIAKINEQQLLATGFNGTILRSDDVGETWQPLTPPVAGLQYEQSFFINGEGWLVSSSFVHTMWHTDNIGDTWTPLTLPIDRFWDGVYFITPDTGIVVSRSTIEGRAYLTFDGGQSWSAAYVVNYPLYGVTGVPNPNGTAWIFGYGSDIEVLPYCNAFPGILNFAGDLFPCQSDTVTFSISSENIDTYSWTFPPGWQILGNANNDTVDVEVGSNSGYIAVQGSNDCGTSGQLSFSAGADLLPLLSNVTGDLNPCKFEILNYTFFAQHADEISFSGLSNWLVIDSGFNFVKLYVLGSDPLRFTVTATNECGSTSSLSPLITPFVIPDVHVNVNGNTLSLSETADRYQWYLNGEMIPGADQDTYVAIESGSYFATLNFFSDCATTSETVEVIVVATNHPSFKPILVYPVPTKDKLYLDGIDGTFNYIITDLTGRIVLTGNSENQSIQVEKLSGGFYVVHILSQGRRYSARFVRG